MSNDELYGQMHQWVEHSEMHLAAKLLLKEQAEKLEQKRFHLIFWPSLIGGIAAILAIFYR